MLTAGRAAKKILSRFPRGLEEAVVEGDMGGVWKMRHPIKVTRVKAKIPLVTGPEIYKFALEALSLKHR